MPLITVAGLAILPGIASIYLAQTSGSSEVGFCRVTFATLLEGTASNARIASSKFSGCRLTGPALFFLLPGADGGFLAPEPVTILPRR